MRQYRMKNNNNLFVGATFRDEKTKLMLDQDNFNAIVIINIYCQFFISGS